LSAGFTNRIDNRLIPYGNDLRRNTIIQYLQCPNTLKFLADSHAFVASDAFAGIADKEGMAGISNDGPFKLLEALLVDANIGGDLLHLTTLVFGANQAVIRMV
jgi:hypothetical protein